MSTLNQVKSNAEIRAEARASLRGKWGIAIVASLLYVVIVAGINYIPKVGPYLVYLVSGAFLLGLSYFFLNIVRNKHASIDQIFAGFQDYVRSLIGYLVVTIFTILWSLLFIVPGIIAALRYSQTFYILADNPEISATEAIDRSKELTKGYKGQLFLLYLSFIGWLLLSILTVGIGLLWLIPYVEASKASFYESLKDRAGSTVG